MMPSSSHRAYSRFIPSEEIGAVTEWKFGAVDGSDPVEPPPLPDDLPAPPPVIDEALHQELVQQACDEGFTRGRAHGRAEATSEWQQRLDDYVAGEGRAAAARMDALLGALGQTIDNLQQQMAGEVLQLACDIARQVVRQELSCNPNALQPIVREALGQILAEGRPATVRLHPQDFDALQAPLAQEFARPGLQWTADAAVAPGGCLVESAGTVVDATVASRWQRAIAALGLASPWELPDGMPEDASAEPPAGGRPGAAPQVEAGADDAG